VLDQGATGVGEPNAAAATVHERGAGALLESRDLLGDGGLGVRERLRCGGERAVLRDRAQDPKLLHIEHNQSLSKPTAV
jgi:hypothetical protein